MFEYNITINKVLFMYKVQVYRNDVLIHVYNTFFLKEVVGFVNKTISWMSYFKFDTIPSTIIVTFKNPDLAVKIGDKIKSKEKYILMGDGK